MTKYLIFFKSLYVIFFEELSINGQIKLEITFIQDEDGI